MGFQQLQKSVWIFPYPCRQEIEFTAEFLRVGRHVRLVEAIDFDGSDEVKDSFF
jgi:DNA-binding transcriptional regulator PaaX